MFVLTLDTFRPDHVGEDTPALVEFLKTARSYERARTVAPLTIPSHVTLFSGLAPRRHGAHDNTGSVRGRDRSYPLLAEEFRARGYWTAGFVSASVLARRSGLDAGFDVYGDTTEYKVPAEQRVPEVRAALAERPAGKPAFVWVHLFDCHSPYASFPGDDRRPAMAEGASDRDRYRGEVRRTDRAVEELLALAGPDAVVVIVSDHGEGLGEHGEATHGPLCYATTADALLAVRAPGFAPGSVDAESPRSLADVPPTLRALLGFEAYPADGTRLDRPGTRPVVTESLQVWRIHGWGQSFSVSDGRFTLVESGPRVEIFDRAHDPDEEHALPVTHPAYERLDRVLSAYRAGGADRAMQLVPDGENPYGAARRPYTHYLTRAENAARPDPTTRLRFWRDLERARESLALARATRQPSLALRGLDALRRLAEEDPDNPAPAFAVAEANRTLYELTRNRSYRKDAAEAAFDAVARGYLSSPVLLHLFDDCLAAGDPAQLRRVLALVRERRVPLDVPCTKAALRAVAILERTGDEDARATGEMLLERARVVHKAHAAELESLLHQ